MNHVFKIYYAACVVGTFCLLKTSGTQVSLFKSTSTTKKNNFFDDIREFHFSVRQNTGSACQSSSDCASPRRCYNLDLELCSSSTEICGCADLDNLYCSTSSDCLENDVCVQSSGNTICAACDIAASNPSQYPSIDSGNCDASGGEGNDGDDEGDGGNGGTEDEDGDDGVSGGGNTGSVCQSSSDCVSPRQCYNLDFELCSSSTEICGCADLDNLYCSTSSDCLENDVCVQGSEITICVGCDIAASNPSQYPSIDSGNCDASGGEGNDGDDGADGGDGGTGDGAGGGGDGNPVGEESGESNNNVCIAVDTLGHLSNDELVFKHHKRAAVLCDQHENCATPGHMVIYQGNGMMMSAYCTLDSVTCKRRVKLVNSPRMKAGLRIPSRHPELQFTALAASKQTVVEHAILKVVLYVGF